MRKEFEAFIAAVENVEKPEYVKVWDWPDAPDALKDLSTHGGDEDWVAWVPKHLAETYIGWMESGSSFGCCSVSQHKLPDGSVVRIGAHA